MLAEVKKILDAYTINVISAARNNLSKTDNTNGELYNSLDSVITDESDGSILVNFTATDYATFYDLGVQGADPNKMPSGSKARYNKAPLSPYRFGTGSSKGGGTLRGAIDKWVLTKPDLSSSTRNDLGQFISRKTMVFLISRSIYFTGLRASEFFKKPFDFFTRQLEQELEDALNRDVQISLNQIDETNEIQIEIR